MTILKTFHQKINMPFHEDNTDQAHRLRNEYSDENTWMKVS